MENKADALQKTAMQVRRKIIEMIGVGKAGHIGGSCSLAEIMTVLYFHKMKNDPKNPKLPERDRVILSKGHSAPVQYACLEARGYFGEEEFKQFKRLGGMLQGHPDLTKVPGIEANTGSLGQGLSMAAGMAAGLKIDGLPSKVYCIVGDGELAEGQVWEAAMAASHYKLDNLRMIIDKNNYQATGAISEKMNSNPVKDKMLAFGWHTIEVDGHNTADIMQAYDEADTLAGKPVCIIAHTVKGKCVPFAENTCAYHNGMMTQEQYESALCNIGGGEGNG